MQERKTSVIYNVYNRKSINCSCGDGQSYLSKYITSVLDQLEVDYKTEVKYDWNKYINPKNNKLTQASIDFVIYHNGREIPLEADGGWHRNDNKMNGQTKKMSEYIDGQRDDNCLKYLNEETIRVSDEGDIKENILNSRLMELFDLSNIDWIKCEEFALSNIVKEVCDYWNQKGEYETTFDVGRIFNLSKTTVSKYLKKGDKLNWCNYDSKYESNKGRYKAMKNNSKLVEIFKNNISLGVFESISELERQSEKLFGGKLFLSGIIASCKGVNKQYKGFTFRYLEDIQNIA